jgi:hypothetical protein
MGSIPSGFFVVVWYSLAAINTDMNECEAIAQYIFSNYAVLASLDLKSKQVSSMFLVDVIKAYSCVQCLSVDPSQPSEVRRLRHEKVKFVSCGEEHTAVLTQVQCNLYSKTYMYSVNCAV